MKGLIHCRAFLAICALSCKGEAENIVTINTELQSIFEDKWKVYSVCPQASHKWREDQKDMSKQKVGSQLSAMNAATAQVVTLTSNGPDETDYTAVGSAVQMMWVLMCCRLKDCLAAYLVLICRKMCGNTNSPKQQHNFWPLSGDIFRKRKSRHYAGHYAQNLVCPRMWRQ